jgi:hypothetical protein
MDNIIRPELTANSFEGKSGKKYLIYNTLTAGRYAAAQKLEAEISTAAPLPSLKKEVQKAYDLLNLPKFADAATVLHNIIHEVGRDDNKQPDRILLYCSLFICAEGEDVSTWNETEAAEKIADWGAIDMRFFTQCWARFQQTFTPDYSTTTPIFLDMEADDQEEKQINKTYPLEVSTFTVNQ